MLACAPVNRECLFLGVFARIRASLDWRHQHDVQQTIKAVECPGDCLASAGNDDMAGRLAEVKECLDKYKSKDKSRNVKVEIAVHFFIHLIGVEASGNV